jgi:hypothetical protein
MVPSNFTFLVLALNHTSGIDKLFIFFANAILLSWFKDSVLTFFVVVIVFDDCLDF